MIRTILVLIGLFVIIPVQAGELENALQAKKTTFLYVTAPWCGACQAFNPTYQKLNNQFGNKYAFVKVNADTKYGNELSRKYNVRYIPYVRIFKQNKSQIVPYECLISYSCASKVLTNF